MSNFAQLGRRAARAALRLRQSNGITSAVPLPVFDFATDVLKLEVRFLDAPSLEGMYVRDPGPVIVIAADRPAGRQAMTCGHEIGHHVFGHGTRLDRYIEEGEKRRFDPDEWLATTFAGYLLMPRPVVLRGLESRKVDPSVCVPEELLALAGWLGVGYGALVRHLELSLGLISPVRAKSLLRHKPQELRASLANRMIQGSLQDLTTADIYVVDQAWTDRAVDLRVGDVAILPKGANFEGMCCILEDRVLRAIQPGIGRAEEPVGGFGVYVRVKRRIYEGLAEIRHMEECDDA